MKVERIESWSRRAILRPTLLALLLVSSLGCGSDDQEEPTPWAFDEDMAALDADANTEAADTSESEPDQEACRPASDEQLCTARSAGCGPLEVVDSCGTTRDIDCGSCQEGFTCNTATNQCVCPEPVCGVDFECGVVSNTCGSSVDCGECAEGSECTPDNECVCIAESDEQFCDRYDASCGEITAGDNCGMLRTTSCGECTGGNCESNVCICPEKLEDFCAAQGSQCGMTTGLSACGARETRDCGGCSFGNTCQVNTCAAVKLTPMVPGAGDQFGSSLSADGEWLVVGAPYHDIASASDVGAVYFFLRTPASGLWVEVQKILPSRQAPGGLFGSSVSLRGDRLVIGAPREHAAGMSHEGASYLFELDAVSQRWVEVQRMAPSELGADDAFGMGVTYSGTLLVSTAPLRDEAGPDRGKGYLYVINPFTSSWELSRSLQGPSLTDGSEYGAAVASDRLALVIGAPGSNHYGLRQGAVYFYNASLMTSQIQETMGIAFNSMPGDRFGTSVALAGPWALVGAPGHDLRGMDVGGAHIFEYSALFSSWGGGPTLVPGDGQPGDAFGTSVALTSTRALVGAPLHARQGAPGGAAYVFVRMSMPMVDAWPQTAKLQPFDGQAADEFGAAVSLGLDTAFVAAPLHDRGAQSMDAGAVYTFTLP